MNAAVAQVADHAKLFYLISLLLVAGCTAEGVGGEGRLEAAGQRAEPLAVSGTTSLQFSLQQELWASYSNEPLGNGIQVPVGWGYMAPLTVTVGQDLYAPAFFSCDTVEKKFYCLYLTRNGQLFSDGFNLGASQLPAGVTASAAYQPPMLFLRGREILMAYWVLTPDGTSLINLVSVSLDASYPAPWTRKATFFNPTGQNTNYLGGAMGPNGEIVIAGYGSNVDNPRLDLFRIAPPYTSWQSRQTITSWSSRAFQPVYPHVVVKPDGSINVLVSLANNKVCSETGSVYTQYKNVVDYEGTFGGSFQARWSNATPDVVSDPTYEGDPCLFNSERFAIDHFYDRISGGIYSIVRGNNLTSVDPNNRVGSNSSYTRRFYLYGPSGLITSDLASIFTGLSGTAERIGTIAITRLSNGRFVLIANYRTANASLQSVAISTSWDLSTFTTPLSLTTPWGVGNSVKVAQPDKNGMGPLSQLFFFHSGTPSNPEGLNYHHRFKFYRATPQ